MEVVAGLEAVVGLDVDAGFRVKKLEIVCCFLGCDKLGGVELCEGAIGDML